MFQLVWCKQQGEPAITCTKVVAASLCTQSGTSAGRARQDTREGTNGAMSLLLRDPHALSMVVMAAFCKATAEEDKRT